MFRSSFRRSKRMRYFRSALILLFVLAILDLFSLSWKLVRSRPSASLEVPKGTSRVAKQRIFVASTHWNNEIILRSHWNKAVLDLANDIGPENLFVSIYESGSWDDSKGALRELDAELERFGIQSKIVLDQSTHVDEMAKPPAKSGWIETPRGRKELRRIPYLSGLRNLALEPLAELALNGDKFDKILFLNDVIFTTQDVKQLLTTRDEDYAAACSLDFEDPPSYYDTFALRDSNGDATVTQQFPFFRSSKSRKAMMALQPVPVQSCWNGMVVFDAAPFYMEEPLRFRGVSDSLALKHLEASECCLVHADNPLTASKGVWMNPAVRVGYNSDAYATVHPDGRWPPSSKYIWGTWRNRIRRWTTWTWPQALRINWRVRGWEKENNQNYEPGHHCLINEMQVIVENGWKHL